MPSFFKSISGLVTSSVRHLTGTEEEKVQDKNGKIIYCAAAESPYATLRRQNIVVITFNANGGFGEKEPVRAYSGFYTLPENPFTAPTEKEFTGWGLNPSGPAIQKEKIEIRTNTTLYAIWGPKKYKVSFDPNSGYGPAGKGTMEPQMMTNPIEVAPVCEFEPADDKHIFKFWAKNYSATGKPTRARFPLTLTKDTTLYAMWETLYTISFDGNGAEGEQLPIVTVPTIVTLPTAAEITFVAPSETHFKGWSTDPTGLGEILTEITISDSDVLLYAIWEGEDPNYHLTFDKNGGVGTDMEEMKVPKSTKAFSFPVCTYTKSGKYFNGWALRASANMGSMDGEYGYATADTTYFATWSDKTPYQYIRYNANGGEGSMEAQKCRRGKVGEMHTAGDCEFTREGYEFLHWNTEPDDSGISFESFSRVLPSDESYKDDEYIDLYAIWKGTTEVSLTFYPAIEEGSPFTQTAYLTGSGAFFTLPDCPWAPPQPGTTFYAWTDNYVDFHQPGEQIAIWVDSWLKACYTEI